MIFTYLLIKEKLPCLTIQGLTELEGNKTIVRYLASKLNLIDDSSFEEHQSQVVDACLDLLDVLIGRVRSHKPIGVDNPDDDQIKIYLDAIEMGLTGHNSSQSAIGWVDLAVFDVTEKIAEVAPNALDSYKTIAEVNRNVQSDQRVSGYLKYRPNSSFLTQEAL